MLMLIHNLLPSTFRARDFISISEKHGIPKSMVYRILEEMNVILWDKTEREGFQKLNYCQVAVWQYGSMTCKCSYLSSIKNEGI